MKGISRTALEGEARTNIDHLLDTLRNEFDQERIEAIRSVYLKVIVDRLTDMVWNDLLRSGTPAAANPALRGGGGRIPAELRGRLIIFDRQNPRSARSKVLPPSEEGFRRFAMLALESPIHALELYDVAEKYFGYQDLWRLQVGDLLDEPRLDRMVDRRLSAFGPKARGENRGFYFEQAVMLSQDDLGTRYALLLAAGLELPAPLPPLPRTKFELPRVTGPLIKTRP